MLPAATHRHCGCGLCLSPLLSSHDRAAWPLVDTLLTQTRCRGCGPSKRDPVSSWHVTPHCPDTVFVLFSACVLYLICGEIVSVVQHLDPRVRQLLYIPLDTQPCSKRNLANCPPSSPVAIYTSGEAQSALSPLRAGGACRFSKFVRVDKLRHDVAARHDPVVALLYCRPERNHGCSLFQLQPGSAGAAAGSQAVHDSCAGGEEENRDVLAGESRQQGLFDRSHQTIVAACSWLCNLFHMLQCTW